MSSDHRPSAYAGRQPGNAVMGCCIAVGVALLLAMGGCGSKDKPAAAHVPDALRIGTPMQVRVANPLVDYGYNIFAMLATHDTLIRFDGARNPVPQLATDWQVSPDGRQWRFDLRADALWHDGRPVTAADVKFTFEYLSVHHAASAWLKTLIEDIRVQGATIIFDLSKPHSRFLINCGFIIRILPQHIWETVSDPFKPGDAQVTMGCGPFILKHFDPNQGRLQFKRNERYYGIRPAPETLGLFLNRSFDTLALSLKRGDLDLYYKYASGFPPSHLAVLAGAPDVRLYQTDAMGIPAALGFNLQRQPTADVNVRRAVSEALDYKRIVASLQGGYGKPPDAGFLPPALGRRSACASLDHAPEASQRRLDQAGYVDTDDDGLRNMPHGDNIGLTLLARGDLAGTEALLPILSHNLKAVGIALKVERVDLSTWIERVHIGQFDLVLFRTTPWGMVMDAGSASGYFDSRRRGGGTLANITDPAFHELCDRMLATTDAIRQVELQNDMCRYYARHLPALALCWAVNVYPVHGIWQNWTINQIEGGLLNRQSMVSLGRKISEQ